MSEKKADPSVRRDGRCAQCRKPPKMPKPQKGIDGVAPVTVPGGLHPEGTQGRWDRSAKAAA